MSVEQLKKFEKKKKELKEKVLNYLKERKGNWVSEEQIKENIDFDFEFIGIDEALTGEFWSVRKKIESKAAKVKRDGYYEWIEFYRYKSFFKSTRFWSLFLVVLIVLGVIIFHLYRV